MTIHKEGYRILLILFVILATVNTVSFLLSGQSTLLTDILMAASILLFAFVLVFFRQPSRMFEPDDRCIYAPADGKIVVIEETEENEYFNGRKIQVSIFMSPFNVHINHYSIGGVVKYIHYQPGKNLVAWHPKSSADNERNTIVIENGHGFELMIRQIAGIMARRIVTYATVDQEVNQGDQLGFIKFGSRVDLLLPLDAEIKVSLNQSVTGNRTVIAEI